jgi:hypothetical protein
MLSYSAWRRSDLVNRTGKPSEAMGLLLKSNAPCSCSHEEICGEIREHFIMSNDLGFGNKTTGPTGKKDLPQQRIRLQQEE